MGIASKMNLGSEDIFHPSPGAGWGLPHHSFILSVNTLPSTRYCSRWPGCSDEGKQRKTLSAWEPHWTHAGTECRQLYRIIRYYIQASSRSEHSCTCTSHGQQASPSWRAVGCTLRHLMDNLPPQRPGTLSEQEMGPFLLGPWTSQLQTLSKN